MPETMTTRRVPAAAFRQPRGRLTFAQPETPPPALPNGLTPATCRISARSLDPVYHWYWGLSVHDFDAAQIPDRCTLDWCHDDDQVIGFCDKPLVGEAGLTGEGTLVPFCDGDKACEIACKAQAGVPYECSIDWRGSNPIVEEVPAGKTATANGGRVYAGPVTIFREWSLRSIAICPHGVDGATAAEFADKAGDEVEVRVFTLSDPPAEASAETQAETQTETPPEQPTDPPAEPAAATEPPAEPESVAVVSEPPAPDPVLAARIVELETVNAGLTAELATVRGELEQAQQQLAAAQKLAGIGAGEASPVGFQVDGGQDALDPHLLATYGPGMARVIAAQRIVKPVSARKP